MAPSNTNDNQSIGAAANQAAISGIYNDLFSVAAEVSAGSGSILDEAGRSKADKNALIAKLGACFESGIDDVTFDHWPKTDTLYFKSGCPDEAGRVRSGILKLTFSNYFRYAGSTVTIVPDGYAVNGVSVTGTTVITNLSTNDIYKYSLKVTGGSIKPDTVTIGYASNFTFKQTAGTGTTGEAGIKDDVYSISGSDTLTFPGSIVAVTNISDSAALIRKFDCPYIGQGKAVLTIKSVAASIDYGNGVCDDSALISIGDKVKFVGLPK